MKVLITRPERCTGCGKCEIACSLIYFKQEDRTKSRIHISPPAEAGQPYRITVCTQIGACIDVCPVNALTRARNGVVLLNKKQCVGCLACVGFCPSLAMFYHAAHVEPFKCVSCGKCVEACPEGVLSIEELQGAPASVTDQWIKREVR